MINGYSVVGFLGWLVSLLPTLNLVLQAVLLLLSITAALIGLYKTLKSFPEKKSDK